MMRRAAMTSEERALRADLSVAIRAACDQRGLVLMHIARSAGIGDAQTTKIMMAANLARDGNGAVLPVFVRLAEAAGAMTPELRKRVAAVEADHVAFDAAKRAAIRAVKRRVPKPAVAEVAAPAVVEPDVWPSDVQVVADRVVLLVREPTEELLARIDAGGCFPFMDKDRRAILAMRNIVDARRADPLHVLVLDVDDPNEPVIAPRARTEKHWGKVARWHRPGGRAPSSLGAHVRAIGRVR